MGVKRTNQISDWLQVKLAEAEKNDKSLESLKKQSLSLFNLSLIFIFVLAR